MTDNKLSFDGKSSEYYKVLQRKWLCNKLLAILQTSITILLYI